MREEPELSRCWRSPRRSVLAIAVILAFAAGCGRGERTEEGDGDGLEDRIVEVIDSAGPSGANGVGLEEAEEEAPETIYFDLTQYEWYRRGEPVVIDEARYLPGAVEATGERKLKREGDYQGVEYYASEGASQPFDTIFVPVFPGYWLTFLNQTPEEGGE